MVTAAGSPVWAHTDPVHLTPEAYGDAAAFILNLDSADGQTAGKRERLESVVQGPPAKKRAGGHVKPTPWVVGATAGPRPGNNISGRGGRGRGRGSGSGGGRGGGARGGGRGGKFSRGRFTWISSRGRGHY